MPVKFYAWSAVRIVTRATRRLGVSCALASGRSHRAGFGMVIGRSWFYYDEKAGKWANTWYIGCTRKKAWP